jgi:uracil-DNA glycosylase
MPRLRRIYEEIMERSEVILVMGKIAYLGWRVLTDPQTDYTSMQSKIRMKDILGWQEAKSESMPMIYVTYHPSYIERQRSYNPESFKEIYQQWIFDLVAVKKYLDKKEIRNVRSI